MDKIYQDMDTHGTKKKKHQIIIITKRYIQYSRCESAFRRRPGSSGFPEFNCEMTHGARPRCQPEAHHTALLQTGGQSDTSSARHPFKFTHSGRNIIVPMIENYSWNKTKKTYKKRSKCHKHSLPNCVISIFGIFINKKRGVIVTR